MDGITFGPDGRLFVTLDTAILELDPVSYAELDRFNIEWSYTGPMVITSDGQTGYVAGGDDVFVVDLSSGIDVLDFDIFDGWPTGLLALHTEWADDVHRAWNIQLSPDDDRIYFVGDPTPDDEGSLQYIDGLTSGDFENGLTFSLHPIELREVWPTSPPIHLNADGSLLFDALGNVWDTTTMTLVAEIPLTEWDGLQAEVIVPSPIGNAVFVLAYGQLYNQQDRTEWSGEQVLVANPFDYQPLDLDDDAQTGLVGIDLPNGDGWNSLFAWNHNEMVVSPDGQALYLAGGSSGAFVVDLTGAHISAVQPRGLRRCRGLHVAHLREFRRGLNGPLADRVRRTADGVRCHGSSRRWAGGPIRPYGR
ncbi:MAG: hypothetical protein ACJAYU_001551 [Bradymonadia bacterium]